MIYHAKNMAMALPKTLSELNALDLSFMKDSWSADMIRDGMRAVIMSEEGLPSHQKDVWKYLHDYSPPEGKGFMFCDDTVVSRIGTKMEVGHSGTSFGWTMRNLEFIAKNGLDAYREKF